MLTQMIGYAACQLLLGLWPYKRTVIGCLTKVRYLLSKVLNIKTRKKLDKNPDIGLDLVYDGSKDIVVLPYKGRLSTFPRYSLWNILAKNTNVVNQRFTWH